MGPTNLSGAWAEPADDRDAVGIIDNTNLQRLTGRVRSDEHRDGGIIGLEASRCRAAAPVRNRSILRSWSIQRIR